MFIVWGEKLNAYTFKLNNGINLASIERKRSRYGNDINLYPKPAGGDLTQLKQELGYKIRRKGQPTIAVKGAGDITSTPKAPKATQKELPSASDLLNQLNYL